MEEREQSAGYTLSWAARAEAIEKIQAAVLFQVHQAGHRTTCSCGWRWLPGFGNELVQAG
jgi:hypothetical protein